MPPSNEELAEQAKEEGNNLFKQNDIDGAIKQYEKAIALCPENPFYHSNRSFAYTMKGEYGKAIDDAMQAVKLNDSFAKAWVRLGVAQYSSKEYEEALTSFEKAKERCEPEHNKLLEECDAHIALCQKAIKNGGGRKDNASSNNASALNVDDAEASDSDSFGASQFENRTLDVSEMNKAPPMCTTAWFWFYCNPGSLSNTIGFIIMIIGFALKYSSPAQDHIECHRNGGQCVTYGLANQLCPRESCAYIYPLSMGLFAFAGGVTNWVAIKMLFDEIPFVYGSGIIPKRFKEIRKVVKNVVLDNFFNEAYLNYYIKKQVKNFPFEEKINEYLDTEDADNMAQKLLKEFMPGMQSFYPTFKPAIKKYVLQVVPLARKTLLKKDLIEDLTKVKESVDAMLTDRMQELTPDKVKQLLEKIMREHLYWLIVWGNVFGGLIGVISSVVGLP